MSTPPTPIINLDSPTEAYEVDDTQQWTEESTESAKNGTLQEWIKEPLQMLTSASPTSTYSPNNDANLPSSTTGDIEVKNEYTELPAPRNGTSQFILATNGQNRVSSVPTSNGLTAIPTSSNGYHQVFAASTTTSEYQTPRSNNGYHQQIPVPATANGMYNYGGNYNGYNGVSGYVPNGVHIMNVKPPTQIVHPLRANGGYNFNTPNGSHRYVQRMVNGQLIRPGWVNLNKPVNGIKKQKRNRTAFTSHQMMELEQEYAKARYLDRTRRIELSEALNLNQRTIKIWFQNRRMKEKKDRLEEVTTSDSPPEDMVELPIFLQEGIYVPLGADNDQYNNPGLYAENMQMPAMSSMQPPSLPQSRQMPEPHVMENSIPVYNPAHTYGVQGPQQPMYPVHGGGNNGLSAEENWDLSWIRSINLTDDIE